MLVLGAQVRFFLCFCAPSKVHHNSTDTETNQALESRGLHIIPYGRLQSIFKTTNIRGALQDNVAFKLSFGLTFALAAFSGF